MQFYCELHLFYTLCVISFISNKIDILLIALLLRLMLMSLNLNNRLFPSARYVPLDMTLVDTDFSHISITLSCVSNLTGYVF